MDTYLRFAEAVNRLDLAESGGSTLPELMEDITEGGAASKTKGVLEGAKDKLFGGEEDEKDASGSSTESSKSAGKQRATTRARRGNS